MKTYRLIGVAISIFALAFLDATLRVSSLRAASQTEVNASTRKPMLDGQVAWDVLPESLFLLEQLRPLREKYPSLALPEAQDGLLLDLAKLRKLEFLRLYWENGRMVVRSQAAPRLSDVDFDMIVSRYEAALGILTQKFIGQVPSAGMEKQLFDDIRFFLKGKGYFQPLVELRSEEDSGEVSYKVTIREGLPCLIEKIDTAFVLPGTVKLAISRGDICNTDVINEAIKTLDTDLKEAGYNQNRILEPVIQYDRKTNSARVFISGVLGKKVRFMIKESGGTSRYQPSVFDPESVTTEILRDYRTRGFDDVSVREPQVIARGEEGLDYVYEVNAGTRYFISSIEVRGATILSPSECIAVMDLGSSNSFLPGISRVADLGGIGDRVFNAEKVKEGIENLKAEYAVRGFWDTKISYPRVRKNRDNGEVKLVFKILEGRKSVFRRVIIVGNESVATEDLEELLEVDVNEPLVWSDLIDFQQRIRLYYQSLGYVYVKVDLELDQSATFKELLTIVNLKITEGVKAKIGDIFVTGLVKTKRYVVERELRFTVGDWYENQKIESSRSALLGLGLFNSVTITADQRALTEELEVIPVTVSLKESKPGTVSFGPGWRSISGFKYSLDTVYSNIGGAARRLFVNTELSEERNQTPINNNMLLGRTLGVGYTEPYINYWPIDGTATVEHRARARNNTWEISRSWDAILTHKLRFTKKLSVLSGFFGQKVTNVLSPDVQDEDIIFTENVRIGRLGFRAKFDRTNSLVWPEEGFTLQSTLNFARYPFGGNVSFNQLIVDARTYFPLGQELIFAFKFRYNRFQDIRREGDLIDILPVSERLSSGGNENRGFPYESLGPVFQVQRDGVYELLETGGSTRASYSAELRRKIYGIFGATIFLDVSNSFFSSQEIDRLKERGFLTELTDPPQKAILDNSEYRLEDAILDPELIWERSYASYGIAGNFVTPLGSIDVSYGVPVKRCPFQNNLCAKKRGGDGWQNGEFQLNISGAF